MKLVFTSSAVLLRILISILFVHDPDSTQSGLDEATIWNYWHVV